MMSADVKVRNFKNRGIMEKGLLNGQNPLGLTKVIC